MTAMFSEKIIAALYGNWYGSPRSNWDRDLEKQ